MTQSEQAKPFNPNEHMMQLKSKDGLKDYLPVQWRICWFREACPQGTIETEMVHLDMDKEMEEEAFVWNNEKRRSEKVMKTGRGVAIFRAVVKDGKGGIATGTKMEKAVSFGDYVEKSETGAIGRALAALGYGTAGAPELNEGERIVDSPVDSQERQTSAPTKAELVTEMAIRAAKNAAVHAGIINAEWPEQQRRAAWQRLISDACGAFIPQDRMTAPDLAKVVQFIEEKQQRAG